MKKYIFEVVLPDAEYSRILLVTGGRDFKPMPADYSALATQLLPWTKLVHGACQTGADRWAHEFALGLGFIPILPFEADWSKYNKAAGPIRNQQMADWIVKDGKPRLCLAFRGGKGTASMVEIAHAAKIEVYDSSELRRP